MALAGTPLPGNRGDRITAALDDADNERGEAAIALDFKLHADRQRPE